MELAIQNGNTEMEILKSKIGNKNMESKRTI
jgi:hypothetical protein